MKRRFYLWLIDLCCFGAAFAIALLLTMMVAPLAWLEWYRYCMSALVIWTVVTVARLALRIYTNMWRYASADVYLKIILADVLGGTLGVAIATVLGIGVPILAGVMAVGGSLLATLINRLIYRYACSRAKQLETAHRIKVAIVGAGKTGVLLAQELMTSKKSYYVPCCFVDANPDKVGNYISGLRIYGEGEYVPVCTCYS